MEEDKPIEQTMDSRKSTAIKDSKADDIRDPLSGTITGLVEERYSKASELTEIIGVYMDLMFNSHLRRNHVYLLKSLKLKYLQPMAKSLKFYLVMLNFQLRSILQRSPKE